MAKDRYILAIDQGTSGTKTVVFNREGAIVTKAHAPLSCSFPREGYVEQSPTDLIDSVRSSVSSCMQQFRSKVPGARIEACGISNQRETFLLWDENGKPLTPAIVWQCKRSISICQELEEQGYSDWIQQKTGLIIDPYFSGTKLLWLYRNDEKLRRVIDEGKVYFGTVDTWLLYNLTGGRVYATDYTNASRTLLFNIHDLRWDPEIIEEFSLGALNLPEVYPSSAEFGNTTLFNLLKSEVPVGSMIGDSQAAAIGEGLFSVGDAKVTLGTGSSILLNVGPQPAPPAPGLVSTICFGIEGRVEYAVEGIIVSCGSTITWVKEQLHCAADDHALTERATSVKNNGGVYILPSFSGLGVPFWKMNAKGAIMGLTFGSGYNEIARAALESIGFQVKAALTAMKEGAGVALNSVRFDGGIIHNNFVMQHISDLLGQPVSTMGLPEVSALGAAYLAGLHAGLYENIKETGRFHSFDATIRPDEKKRGKKEIQKEYDTWKMYIDRLL